MTPYIHESINLMKRSILEKYKIKRPAPEEIKEKNFFELYKYNGLDRAIVRETEQTRLAKEGLYKQIVQKQWSNHIIIQRFKYRTRRDRKIKCYKFIEKDKNSHYMRKWQRNYIEVSVENFWFIKKSMKKLL